MNTKTIVQKQNGPKKKVIKDNTRAENKKNTRMGVNFLYSVREVNPTVLESIKVDESKGTTQTEASVPHILDVQPNKTKKTTLSIQIHDTDNPHHQVVLIRTQGPHHIRRALINVFPKLQKKLEKQTALYTQYQT